MRPTKTKAPIFTREQEDLKMMKSPDYWPRWPILPIKKRENNETICAILFANGKPVVIHSGMYALEDRPGTTYGEKFAGLKQEEFESFEAIITAGWRVD